MFEFIDQSNLSNQSYPSDPSTMSTPSISPPPFLPDKISFELFPMFSLPAPQFSLELFRDGLRVTEVSPLPFSRGDIEGLKQAERLLYHELTKLHR